MEHHRYPNHTFSHQNRQSPYQRGRDDRRRNHTEDSHSRQKHQYQSGPASRQSPLSDQCLSTRREQYERDFPVYKQPVEVGCFSLDSERRFFNDSRQMRYYVEPDRCPNFDLRNGYKDRYVKRDESVKEKLDHMLRWILANRSKLSSTASSW